MNFRISLIEARMARPRRFQISNGPVMVEVNLYTGPYWRLDLLEIECSVLKCHVLLLLCNTFVKISLAFVGLAAADALGQFASPASRTLLD